MAEQISISAQAAVDSLISSLYDWLTQLIWYSGCQVTSVADVDSGWVVARIQDGTNQRCRWKKLFPIAVGDYVDVLYDPRTMQFEIFKPGGATIWSDPTCNIDQDSVRTEYTNSSTGTLNFGEVVVFDSGADLAVDTTTTLGDLTIAGVVVIGAAVGSLVQLAQFGFAHVLVDGNVTRGQFLKTSTTRGQATPTTGLERGTFAISLTGNAAGAGVTVEAFIVGHSWFTQSSQKVTVGPYGCDFTLPSLAITYINGLATGPASGREFDIEIEAGTFTEAADVTIPQYVHAHGQGEATIIDMDDYYLEFAADTSGKDFEVIGTADDSGVLVFVSGNNVVLDGVRVHLEDAGRCVFLETGIENVELYHVICEADAGPSVGFWIFGATSVLLWDCKADDSTNFAIALDLDDTVAGGTVTTKFCEFISSTADVVVDATYTWKHFACQFNPDTCTFTGTETPLSCGKTNFDDTVYVRELEFDATTELTIAAGAVTKTQSYHRVDTQGDAATDDLDTINGGVTGDILIIRAENDARTVVVKHGTGNIDLVDGTDVTLDDTEDHLALIYDGADWCDVKGRQIIANGVTKTVGAAGDFTTIQAAIDWFKNKLVVGLCKIDVDAGSYDEAVVFEDLFLAKSGALELEGDTRILAGIGYVDGCVCNKQAWANGGTFTDANLCTLATNGARDEITVAGGTVDPDFNADGWGNGDEILVYADDGNFYERIINSINPGGAGNHVIEITVALPVGGTLGNDGTALALKPDRQIERTVAGPCITVDAARGILIDGWFLDSHTGASCNGVYAINDCNVECQNLLTFVEDWGIYALRSTVTSLGFSMFGGSRGGFANQGALTTNFGVAVACTLQGYYGTVSTMECYYAIAVHCDVGFRIANPQFMYAQRGQARQNNTGYYSGNGAFLQALNTDRYNNGNGVDYNPAPPGLPGYGNGNGNADLYASN